MPVDASLADPILSEITTRLGACAHRPIVVGLCGAQGSGKSTLAETLEHRLNDTGLVCATLSLDDLYKTKAERASMAEQIHPLFRTRGVPGTHDLSLWTELLVALEAGQSPTLPRFDKAIDDRTDRGSWPIALPHLQVLLFEGWFVGARPQLDDALVAPTNVLERDEDADGRWRRFANAALAAYDDLFERIDLLVLLAAPSFDIVKIWRTEQEHALRQIREGGMTDDQIARFVQHYERLTKHILEDMPGYADMVFRLDHNRRVVGTAVRQNASAGRRADY